MTLNIGNIYAATVQVLKTYPALSLMLINIAILLLAHFGLHVTPSQLTEIAVVAASIVGIVVHNSVTPNVKVTKEVQ